MALFGRKKTDSVLPEVDEYYQAERRDRGWLAWVLAFVSVAIVALVIIGLFLGGRWAYNKIANNDDDVAVTDNSGSNDDNLTIDGQPNDSDDNDDQPAETDGNSTDNSNANGSSSSNGSGAGSTNSGTQSGGSSSNNSNTGSTSTSTPATGDASGNLPNTGPADMVGIFAGVTALAGGAHYVVSRKRAAK